MVKDSLIDKAYGPWERVRVLVYPFATIMAFVLATFGVTLLGTTQDFGPAEGGFFIFAVMGGAYRGTDISAKREPVDSGKPRRKIGLREYLGLLTK